MLVWLSWWVSKDTLIIFCLDFRVFCFFFLFFLESAVIFIYSNLQYCLPILLKMMKPNYCMIWKNYFFILRIDCIIICYTNLILSLFREKAFPDHTLFLWTGRNLPNLIILIFMALWIIITSWCAWLLLRDGWT
jgi:hypothetical protein